MFSNKMAVIGLVILIVSTFIALAAPLVAPYSPKATLLSSPGSQPEWVTYFPDGYYLSNGDPDDASTCPTPSADPNNRGTVCTFYKYVSGPFQAAQRHV